MSTASALPGIALVALLASLAACNPFRGEPATEVTSDVDRNTRWTGTLVSPASMAGAIQMTGTATMQPGTNGDGTRFSLLLANATPGGLHPWQMHRGRCGADEGVVGAASDYGTIRIGEDGRGVAAATLPLQTPTSGTYFVTVQASPTNLGTVVACGNLAPPTT